MTRWLILASVVALGLALDLAAHRGDRVDSRKRAVVWTTVWVGISVAFGGWLGLVEGKAVAAQFFAAYLVEKSLSVDNLLVFLLIFSRLQIPAAEQRRVLFWGIVGALTMRGLFIAAGIAAVNRWQFLLYGFGAILLMTGVRLLVRRPQTSEPRLVRWLRRFIPITHGLARHRFVVVEEGRRAATPLLLALLTVELTDVLFALDSIPAAFGVTREPFVLYSSNILAVLGLRALFVVVGTVLSGLRYVRFGVAFILVFVGGKMLLSPWIEIAPWASLLVVTTALATTVAASMSGRRPRVATRGELP